MGVIFKIAAVILVLGIVFFCLGLLVPSLIVSAGSGTRGCYGLLLLSAGFCCCLVGILLLAISRKKRSKQAPVNAKRTPYVVAVNFNEANFIFTFVVTVVVGLVMLWITDVLFGAKDPLFHQVTITGLVFGALLLALTTSYER